MNRSLAARTKQAPERKRYLCRCEETAHGIGDRPRKAKALDLSLDAEDLEVEGSSSSSTRAVTPVA
jgi:hypothetical protein